MSSFANKKPHAVLIPYPVQGHINPLFKLAKLLHLRGFHITFVNTEYNHKRLLKSRGPNALDGFADFCFETIPDGLTPVEDDDGNVSQDILSLCKSIRKNFLHFFRELLARLDESANSGLIPPVTSLVSDCYIDINGRKVQVQLMAWHPKTMITSNIHRMSLGFESDLVRRYLIAAWSVYTTIFEPTRYERNFSNAYTIASNSFSVVA
ncbi:UDP-glycosyltransferase superfamily protein [Medicago truncatula]|uniref:UDP-glycosyltransferase superfamily protein n=1 Tax=Medicago truncatula TaxID=3880 RepID=A0A072TQS5_MEDTR|nr:UDP-glycosyltransferase superfamily protein [Medicago truncatula]